LSDQNISFAGSCKWHVQECTIAIR